MTGAASWRDDFGLSLEGVTPPRLRRLERGEAVFERGDPSNHVFCVRSGRVRLALPGSRFTLSIACAGQRFGELALAGEPYRRWSAVATQDGLVSVGAVAPVRVAASTSPATAAQVVALIGSSAARLDARLEALMGRSATARLGRTLVQLAEDCGEPCTGGLQLGRLTHQDLAQLTSASRETVTLALGRLERRGLISKSRRQIVVRDLPGLRSLT